MKLTRAVTATTLFILLLLITYYINIEYFDVHVVLYAAITDAFLSSLLAGIGLFSMAYFRPLGNFEKMLLIVVWLLAGYGFAISVPTVIDRSLSFYLLEKMQQRGGGIKLESFEEIFAKEYMKEHRLIDVRLTEQLESGTIIINDSCVKLTQKGELIATFSRFYRQHFLPKKRLIMGEYSDDLTNPFRYSSARENYTCQ